MERWEKLPEALRWILYVPVVIVLPALIGLVVRVVLAYFMPGWRWFAPIANFLVPVIGAYWMVQVYFLIVFLFAPRGKKIAGWFFYVPLMLWSTIMFLLLTARRLSEWGLFGDVSPDGDWQADDWAGLGQSLVWIVMGTIVFRRCLSEENERLAEVRLDTPSVQRNDMVEARAKKGG